MRENEISEKILGAAIEVHRVLGPGLLESVYEESLCCESSLRGIKFERQIPVPIDYKGFKLATDLRLDLLVEEKVIVDTKAKEMMTEKDRAKTMTYLRLTGRRLGVNINFHEVTLIKGVQRIVNGLYD